MGNRPRQTFGFLLVLVVVFAGLMSAMPVSDIAASGGKVKICHRPPGNPANVQEIETGGGALAGHIAHGDTLNLNGCGVTPTEVPPTPTAVVTVTVPPTIVVTATVPPTIVVTATVLPTVTATTVPHTPTPIPPTVVPTEEPTVEPTVEPTMEPTAEPTVEPTMEPTMEPTAAPTEAPTEDVT